MKIALVSQEYPPETARGGIGSQTFAKAKGLSALGHQVFVISRSIDEKRHECSDGNITVIRIPGMENLLPEMTPQVQWITHSVAVAAEIETLNKQVNLDIIDFPEWAAEGYCYLLNRKEWNGVPAVIQLHGPLVMLAHTIGWPEMKSEFYAIGSHMEATCVRLADAVYSSSECSAQWIRTHYEPNKENIPVIHLGIDTKQFSPKAVTKNEQPTIIFIGKIVENKGVRELVVAASRLTTAFPGLQLKMFGRGDDRFIASLENEAERLGAKGMLNFAGFAIADIIPDELSRAHIFAAPSWYEGGPGFVYLEAMACGLPVIACSGSGAEEIIQHNENGILVPPRDADSLQKALHTLLIDRAYAASMGNAGRNYVLKECDSKDCLKRLEDFYFTVVKKNTTEALIN